MAQAPRRGGAREGGGAMEEQEMLRENNTHVFLRPTLHLIRWLN